MSTISLALSGQISEPVEVGPGSRVTATGSGYVEWTESTLADVRNGVAVWKVWPKGQSTGFADTLRRVVIRGRATGALSISVDEARGDEGAEGAYWQEQVPAWSTDAAGNVAGLVGSDGQSIRRLPAAPGVTKMRSSARILSYASGAYTALGATGTTVTYSADDAFPGGQNYRITTGTSAGDETGFRLRWTSGGPSTDGQGGLILPIRVIAAGVTPSAELKITISNNISAGTANVNLLQYLHLNGLTGWQYLYYPLSDFATGGTPGQVPNGTIYDVQIQLKTQTAGVAADVVVGPLHYSAGTRSVICLGCDDGLLSQYYELFPMMAKAGLVGSIGIARDYVGTTGYMTESMITEMYQAGWDVVVHGVTSHTALATYAAIVSDMQRNRDYVAERWPGAHEHYTYVGGAVVEPHSYTALQALGFKTARLVNRAHWLGVGLRLPAEAWLRMPSSSLLDATVSARVTDIGNIATKQAVFTELHFHSVGAVSPEVAVELTSRANAQTVIDAVKTRVVAGDAVSMTRSQFYNACV